MKLFFLLSNSIFHTMNCIVYQEVQNSAQSLQEEKEEVKMRLEEATARVIQLEEDLIGVTQKGLQKETELDKWVWVESLAQIQWFDYAKVCLPDMMPGLVLWLLPVSFSIPTLCVYTTHQM